MWDQLFSFLKVIADKNPEVCLIAVYSMALFLASLGFIYKMYLINKERDSLIQTLFADYKKTIESSTEIISKVFTEWGESIEVIRQNNTIINFCKENQRVLNEKVS